ncbi:MAG: hypothetical protein HZA67_05115 [Rhodospirillales bacterium]|nr:hypothetical protein [Rhodospirillales bacterium]
MTEQTLKGPYVSSDGKPELKKSVVAFIDILGFNDTIKKASAEGKGQELLSHFHMAFREGIHWLGIEASNKATRLDHFKNSRAIKLFSDNVVIAYPIRRNGESEFGLIFDDLAWFQMWMVPRGYFVRGAITVGDIFIDEITAFGDGLLEAYEAEQKVASVPRIILTEKAETLTNEHLTYYGNPGESPQNQSLLRDADERLFLNYMDCLLIAEAEQEPMYYEIEKHRDITIQRLREHANNSAIFEKYAWTARYHNFFCSEYRDFGAEYLIPLSELDRPFSRLVAMPVTNL